MGGVGKEERGGGSGGQAVTHPSNFEEVKNEQGGFMCVEKAGGEGVRTGVGKLAN